MDLSEKDGLLREMVMLDEKGEPVLTQRFLRVETGATVAGEQFRFVVPDGVTVREAPKGGSDAVQ